MKMIDQAKINELNETEPSKAEVIEFYVPSNFVRPVRWTPSWRCGKVLAFRPDQKKTA